MILHQKPGRGRWRPRRSGRGLLAACAGLAVILGQIGCSSDEETASTEQSANDHAADAPDARAVEASLRAAEEYLDADRPTEAAAILRRLIDRKPDEPRAHEMYARLLLLRAIEHQQAGHRDRSDAFFAEAYEHYRQATDLRPDSGGLHQSAGEVAQMAGLDDEAAEHYRRAAEINRLDPKPRLLLAQIRIARGAHDEARTMLEEVIDLDPDEALAHASLANIAAQRGRYDEALRHMAEARSIDPDRVSLRVIEASIHRERGEPRRALELLIHLGDDDRGRMSVAEEIARSFRAVDRPVDAAEAWAHVYRQNPLSEDAWRAAVKAGEAYLDAGEREQAWLWLQQAGVAAGDEPEVRALEQRLAAD